MNDVPLTSEKRHAVEALARTWLGERTSAEHILEGKPGEEFHPAWIPEHTSSTCYITAKHALNLKSPAIGMAGDWHSAGWWFPLHNDNDHARTAFMSNGRLYADACAETAEVLGERGLVDARDALQRLGHPAGSRPEKVWAATHVRAIVDYAWKECRSLLEDGRWEILLEARDPTQIRRWIATKEQWVELHAMAKEMGEVKSQTEAMHNAWEDWRAHQCPSAHYNAPVEYGGSRRWSDGWSKSMESETDRRRLAPIKATAKEEEQFELIVALARAVSETLEEMNIPHAMKGGSALKISKGLTRPSTDVDFEIEGSCNPEEVIRKAFEKLDEWEEVKVPRQLTMGIDTEIHAKRKRSDKVVETKLDLVPVGMFDGEDKTIPRDQTELIQGIRVWKFEELAERKLRTLVGKRPRREARDVYDAAYLTENHPEVIKERTWDKLGEWNQATLKSEQEKKRWKEIFQEDEIMQKASAEEALRSMTLSLLDRTRAKKAATMAALSQMQPAESRQRNQEGEGVRHTRVTGIQSNEAARAEEGEQHATSRERDRDGTGARAVKRKRGGHGGYGE